MYKAVRYIRLSHADNNGVNESDSVTNQRRLIDEYVKKQSDIEIVGEYVDDGVSGITNDRPDLIKMMREIDNENVNCIITKDLSRFGRDYLYVMEQIRYNLPSRGVRFIAINDNFDTLVNNGDDLIVSVKVLFNDNYSRDFSIKTRSAIAIKRKNGDFVAAFPVYGYLRDSGNRNKLIIDEYPASIIREIYNMKLDGYSAIGIADILNKRGVHSPLEYKRMKNLPYAKGGFADRVGGKWSATAVIRILKDETYTGTLVQGKSTTPNYKLKKIIIKHENEWDRVENTHEPIVSKSKFVMVKKILKLDTRISPGEIIVDPFSGILLCGGCGTRMTKKTVPYKDLKYLYYVCPAGRKNGCTDSARIRMQDLKDCTLDIVKTYITGIIDIDKILSAMDAESMIKRQADNLNEQLNSNKIKISKIQNYKAKLYSALINGDLDKNEKRELNIKYIDEINLLIQANNNIKKEIEEILSFKHERMAWIKHFKEFENIEAIDRRMVVCLIHSITIHGKKDLEITFNYKNEYKNVLSLLNDVSDESTDTLQNTYANKLPVSHTVPPKDRNWGDAYGA